MTDQDRNELQNRGSGLTSEGPASGRGVREPFAARQQERSSMAVLPWALAGAVVLLVLGLALAFGRGKAHGPAGSREQDAYGTKLAFAGLQMSESTSLSGGKSTFIDGTVKNTGDQTVTGATVQVLFGNDEALPAQKEQVPLQVIRSREPYIDTVPLSVAPLAPGQTADFRLIFEDVGSNWNQQMPGMRVLQTFTACKDCR